MQLFVRILLRIYYVWLFLGGIAWVLNIPARLGIPLIQMEWLAPYLGVAIAAVYLKHP